jgi:hypothetical protein
MSILIKKKNYVVVKKHNWVPSISQYLLTETQPY